MRFAHDQVVANPDGPGSRIPGPFYVIFSPGLDPNQGLKQVGPPRVELRTWPSVDRHAQAGCNYIFAGCMFAFGVVALMIAH